MTSRRAGILVISAAAVTVGALFAWLGHEPGVPGEAATQSRSLLGDGSGSARSATDAGDGTRALAAPSYPRPANDTSTERGRQTSRTGREAGEAYLAARRTQARKHETEQLLAAGFTASRIEWIRGRVEELEAMRARADAERSENGLPKDADPFRPRYLADSDLDLRREIGEEEYLKYRQATGRATAVTVTGVPQGSNAATAGLRQGDEIVRYGGNRVFNYYDLEKAATENKSSGAVAIEVRRGGKAIRLLASGGALGIRKETWAEPRVKALNLALAGMPRRN